MTTPPPSDAEAVAEKIVGGMHRHAVSGSIEGDAWLKEEIAAALREYGDQRQWQGERQSCAECMDHAATKAIAEAQKYNNEIWLSAFNKGHAKGYAEAEAKWKAKFVIQRCQDLDDGFRDGRRHGFILGMKWAKRALIHPKPEG